MVVDDALVIRGMLSKMVEQTDGMEVVASVGDGERALRSLERHDVDVVILDIEMPRMDGLTALPKIIEATPGIQVLMASTLTLRNAEISMKAMSLGASDYIPKPSSSGELRNADDFRQDLIRKVQTLGRTARRQKRIKAREKSGAPAAASGFRASGGSRTASAPSPASSASGGGFSLRPMARIKPDIIAIGSSTGGPQALFKVLKGIGADAKQPIIITQHMPPTFTTILAEHIEKACGRPTSEATDGMVIEPGKIYVAPGDFHMQVESKAVSKVLRLNQDPPENFCRPAVDPMMRSVVQSYGKNVLAVILTGMGSDGKNGCEGVVAAGGIVLVQDEQTSVVWGMPGAAAKAGVCSAVMPVDAIGPEIARVASGGAL